MVSTWRFWSGKEINFSRSHPFQLLFVMAIVFYVVLRYSNVVLVALGLTYMFSGIWARAAYGWSRRRRRRPAGMVASDDVAAEADSPRPL
jgi:CDP-diacylglycerol--serine O-phosphatidyltransferase